MSLPRLFFIGVGNMGNPMAANLIRAGYALTVHDLDRSKAENLLALGAHWADSLEQGAAQADIALVSLPGPKQVREVMLGEGGLIAAMRSATTIIDTSTSAVDLVRELVDVAAERGIDFLEAPVTNAIDAAAAGKLSIFVCGAEAVFKKHQP